MEFIEALTPPRNEDIEPLIFAPARDLSSMISAYKPYNPSISAIASSIAGAEMSELLIMDLVGFVSSTDALKQYAGCYSAFGKEVSAVNKNLQGLIKNKNIGFLLQKTRIDVRIAEKFLPETIRYVICGAVSVCKDKELISQLEKIRKRNYAGIPKEEFLSVLAEQEQTDTYYKKGIQQAKEWRTLGIADAIRELRKKK